MRGAVLYGQRDVRFEERAVPTMAMTHIAIQEIGRASCRERV